MWKKREVIKSIVSIDYGFSAVLRAGVRISTGWGLRIPSSSPIIAQNFVAGIKGYALIDACGRIPRLDEIACMPDGAIFNDKALFQSNVWPVVRASREL